MKTLTTTLLACLALCGCSTTRDLDPSGVYRGDKALFEAERAFNEADRLVDQIEDWAARNPIYLASNPKAAEFVAGVREDADKLLYQAMQAIEAYRSLRSAGNLETMQGKLALLREALAIYAQYQIESIAQEESP